ncbi:unnamed protein product [Tilletia controversa]|uniref:REJ domain-containing protein n=2 Tax=Tilletia TaxID=13289 RepID=A0A177VFP4_9BASI|nr:hypothetical protein CF336_g1359 [Tilletia laevis]KAE8265725.1 hypothetical protein A4X03_0g70 [Tilletia caries]CAD6905800.1 unnamed protein product [Tilletia controversa]KAE8207924.1 hypothetical protein CF335_g786 [Tilletia laevis]CAD6884819.1 unnamed protein product [Tilletia caries]
MKSIAALGTLVLLAGSGLAQVSSATTSSSILTALPPTGSVSSATITVPTLTPIQASFTLLGADGRTSVIVDGSLTVLEPTSTGSNSTSSSATSTTMTTVVSTTGTSSSTNTTASTSSPPNGAVAHGRVHPDGAAIWALSAGAVGACLISAMGSILILS